MYKIGITLMVRLPPGRDRAPPTADDARTARYARTARSGENPR